MIGCKTNILFFLSLLSILCLSACTVRDNNQQTGSETTEQQVITDTEDNEENTENKNETDGESSGEESISFDFAKKTVRLNSGYEMPIVGLGTYAFSDEEMARIAELERGEKHEWY